MKVLWNKGEATVSEVREALIKEKSLAITTIGTVLSRLEKRRLISHIKEGRQFIYKPVITEKQATNSMVSGLVNQLFKGEPSTLMNYLINENDFDEGELSALEAKIEEYKRAKSTKK